MFSTLIFKLFQLNQVVKKIGYLRALSHKIQDPFDRKIQYFLRECDKISNLERIATLITQLRLSKLTGDLKLHLLHNRGQAGKYWVNNQCTRTAFINIRGMKRKNPDLLADFPFFSQFFQAKNQYCYRTKQQQPWGPEGNQKGILFSTNFKPIDAP